MFDALAVASFWVPVGLTLYHWLGFPALLAVSAISRGRGNGPAASSLPSLSVAVAAHNEESVVAEKIRNCLDLDYPADKLEVLFCSDASDDGTDAILASVHDPRFRWLRLHQRGGKTAAVNLLIAEAKGELILFTDADISLAPDAAQRMVERFGDPSVGVVQVNYRRVNRDGSVAESIFDRWETAVKTLEGRIGALATANGMGMMLRKAACRPIPPDTIHDDLLLGLQPFRLGYAAVYEPRAMASCRIEHEGVEFRRRVKIGRGNMQALLRDSDLLSPRYGLKALTVFSHKTLRTLLAYMLPLVLVGCALKASSPLFAVAFGIQVACYTSMPLLLVARGKWRRLLVPQYYLLMNIALLAGGVSYLFGRREAYWERTPRDSSEVAGR